MATEIKTNVVKVKPNQDASSSKGKSIMPVNKKKVEISSSSSKQIVDSKQKSVATIVKSETKEKATSSSSKTTSTTTAVKVKHRKVYNLPGQRYDPPEEREPLRIFYESLSKQIPSSDMAEFWMMEHGLLPPERAKRAFERKQKRQQQLRTGTPIMSPLVISRAESSQGHQASKNGDLNSKKRMRTSS